MTANISGWKSNAIHVEDTDEDDKKAFSDKSWCQCQTCDLQCRMNTLHPAYCTTSVVVVSTSDGRISCCGVHVWKMNSGETPEPILWTFCGVHIWKRSICASPQHRVQYIKSDRVTTFVQRHIGPSVRQRWKRQKHSGSSITTPSMTKVPELGFKLLKQLVQRTEPAEPLITVIYKADSTLMGRQNLPSPSFLQSSPPPPRSPNTSLPLFTSSHSPPFLLFLHAPFFFSSTCPCSQ